MSLLAFAARALADLLHSRELSLPADLGEERGFQARTANKGAVYLRLRDEVREVVRRHAAAVLDPNTLRSIRSKRFARV